MCSNDRLKCNIRGKSIGIIFLCDNFLLYGDLRKSSPLSLTIKSSHCLIEITRKEKEILKILFSSNKSVNRYKNKTEESKAKIFRQLFCSFLYLLLLEKRKRAVKFILLLFFSSFFLPVSCKLSACNFLNHTFIIF